MKVRAELGTSASKESSHSDVIKNIDDQIRALQDQREQLHRQYELDRKDFNFIWNADDTCGYGKLEELGRRHGVEINC